MIRSKMCQSASWQGELNPSVNDGLDIDHGNEEESDSSGLHEEVKESDSSEDEVC